MTEDEVAAVVARAFGYGVRVRANQRPKLLDDVTVRRAHHSHLSGVNLVCLGRYYGVRAAYLGDRFRELELEVRNYTHRAERAKALAADEERTEHHADCAGRAAPAGGAGRQRP